MAGDTRALQVSEKYSVMHLSVVCSKVRVLKSFPKKILGEKRFQGKTYFSLYFVVLYVNIPVSKASLETTPST